ncbi:MAG: PQQ-like beta-propeller repeat protein, partial [Caldisericia bacterium]|nr:PQQ-like beta-propeller repeat protein [Caldisericia bacterium]
MNWEHDIDEPGSTIACGERLYIGNNVYSAVDGQKLKTLDKATEPIAVANERLFMSSFNPRYISLRDELIGLKCYVDDACLEVSTDESIDFGEYYQSKPTPRRIILTNCTTYKYDVKLHHPGFDWFEVSPDSFALAPGERKDVTITPTKDTPDNYYGLIVIKHDNTTTSIETKMKILSDYDVLKELERTTRGELTLSNVDVASENTLTLEITNPFEVGLHLSLEANDTWLSVDNQNFVLPANNSKTIRIKVDPKRLYSGGLSVVSSVDLILGGSRKSFDISITTAHDIEEIDGWYTQYGNNQNTNYADCTISESEPDEVWSVDLGYSEVVSQPIISKGRVYVGTADGVLHCLNASTGEKFWEFDTDKYNINPPSISGNLCLITASTAICCINVENGKKVWSTSLDASLSSPSVAEGRVFVSAGYGGKVVCFNLTNGKIIWVSKIP